MMGNRCIFKIAYRKRPLMSLGFIQLRKGFFRRAYNRTKKAFQNKLQISADQNTF